MGKIQVTVATTANLPNGIQKSVRLHFPEDLVVTDQHNALNIFLTAEDALETGKRLVEVSEMILRQS